LALPGSYHEKITHLGRSLASFTRLKHLDLSRNAIFSLEVFFFCAVKCIYIYSAGIGAFAVA